MLRRNFMLLMGSIPFFPEISHDNYHSEIHVFSSEILFWGKQDKYTERFGKDVPMYRMRRPDTGEDVFIPLLETSDEEEFHRKDVKECEEAFVSEYGNNWYSYVIMYRVVRETREDDKIYMGCCYSIWKLDDPIDQGVPVINV